MHTSFYITTNSIPPFVYNLQAIHHHTNIEKNAETSSVYYYCFVYILVKKRPKFRLIPITILSKSFTAHCQTAETCKIRVCASTTGQAYEVGLSIYVNIWVQCPTGSYSVNSLTSATISFPVSDGNNIMITVDEIDKASSDMLLTLLRQLR